MTVLSPVPNGFEEIKIVYGDPDKNADCVLDLDWAKANLVSVALPYLMRLSWQPTRYIQRIQCHRLIEPALIDALCEIEKGRDLHAEGLDYWGGCFNFRPARGLAKLSTHAWGIAVDINPHLGELGKPPEMPGFIVKAFEDRGFVWGGRWPRSDGMHFQACGGY